MLPQSSRSWHDGPEANVQRTSEDPARRAAPASSQCGIHRPLLTGPAESVHGGESTEKLVPSRCERYRATIELCAQGTSPDSSRMGCPVFGSGLPDRSWSDAT